MIRLTAILFSLLLVFLIPAEDNYHWVKLNGPWVITFYGQGDETIGQHHAAYWNGLRCQDAANPGRPFPDRVTSRHFGIALPGPEFYCLPVKVCYRGRCEVGTAVDVMRDYRLKKPGEDGYFNHADLWIAYWKALGLTPGRGIVWDEGIEVYVGVARDE